MSLALAAVVAGCLLLLRLPLCAAQQAPLSAYSQLVLADGAVGYWSFDDATSGSLADASGHGWAGALQGGVSQAPSSPVLDDGGALAFDGASGAASAPVKLSNRSAITLEFWLAWDTFADDDRLAFELSSGDGTFQTTDGFLVDPNSGFWPGQFEVSLGDSEGASYNTVLFARPSTGDWHHYAIVFDRSAPPDRQITPYIDGAPVSYTKPPDYARAPAAGHERFVDGTLSMMSRGGHDLFGAGGLDNVAIYPAALSASRIAEHVSVALGGASPLDDTSKQTLTPQSIPLSAPELANPLRGQYEWYDETVDPPGWPFQDSYARFYWKQLEPSQGNYDFSALDAALAQAAARGGRFGFRIMSVCTGCGAGGVAVPEYLRASSHGWYVTVGGERNFIPDWNSNVYLSRWEALMRALGARYANDPRVGVIDIGGVGNWSEWHNFPYEDNYPGPQGQVPITPANANRVVDATLQAFPPANHLFVIRTANSSAVHHALAQSPHVGIRFDCLGGGRDMEGDRDAWGSIADVASGRWKTAPVVSEWCSTVKPGTNLFQGFGVPQVQEFHVSMLSSGNFAKPGGGVGAYSPAEQAGFISANKMAGYRFVLDSMTLPRVVGAGTDFDVVSQWENVNVAPAYLPSDVMLQFRDADGTVIWQARSGLDLRQLLPTGNSPMTWTDHLKLGDVAPGTYQVTMQVLDPDRISPPLQLAIQGRQPDGSYPLGTVTVR